MKRYIKVIQVHQSENSPITEKFTHENREANIRDDVLAGITILSGKNSLPSSFGGYGVLYPDPRVIRILTSGLLARLDWYLCELKSDTLKSKHTSSN